MDNVSLSTSHFKVIGSVPYKSEVRTLPFNLNKFDFHSKTFFIVRFDSYCYNEAF